MDFTGWQQLILDRAKFSVSRTPLGWDTITNFYFTASGWGNEPNPENIVHIDNIILTGDPPQPQDVLANLRVNHPRLLIPNGDWAGVKTRMEQDQQTMDWFASVKRSADNKLDDAVSEYVLPDGIRLLATSREVLDRMYLWAFAYRMTDSMHYADRAYQELTAVAAFPDWNPSHFLDVGEMTHAFAIAYDWLYDAWTQEQRGIIRQAIITHGLNAYLTGHEESAWWLFSEYNWNTVTNGGIGMGALALASTDSLLAWDIINKTLMSMEGAGSVAMFGPDGAWAESPGYWTYATRYLFTYTASLETALGSTFWILDVPGISETGGFPVYMTGPTWRLFNYADGGDGRIRAPWLFWLGEKFSNPLYHWFQTESASPKPLDIIWYQSSGASPTELDLPLDKYYRKVEVATFRSSWSDPDALFAGFKAGDNDVGHSHLDLGEFILDALNERWARDLAAEDYNIGDYFSSGGWNAPRWTYYRCRAEANNTLVINPDSLADQDPDGDTYIIRFSTRNDGEGLAVADITDAYNEMGATRVWRGISLFNNRTQVLLQDEITASSPADVWWFMHTEATAEITPDGQQAVLSQNGKRLAVNILPPGTGSFEMMAAVPLPTSPNPAGQRDNGDKLAIHIQNVTDLTLPVLFTPLGPTDDPANIDILEIRPLADSTWPTGQTVKIVTPDSYPYNKRIMGPERQVYRLHSDRQVVFNTGMLSREYPQGAVSLSIRDLKGRDIFQRDITGSTSKISWNLVDRNHTPVTAGMYIYCISIRDRTGKTSSTGRMIILP
jgi:hypothetical protein